MIAKKEPDFLYPIKTNGRDEIIVTTYDHVIRLCNEDILNYMIYSKYDEYVKRYPGLKIIKNNSPTDKFVFAKSFPLNSILNIISSNASEAFIEKDCEKLKSSKPPVDGSVLRLPIALDHLIHLNIVKKLYVVDENMTDYKKEILKNIFSAHYEDIVIPVNSSIVDFVKSTDEKFTTIITYDIEHIKKLIDEAPDKSRDVYFLCSGVFLNNFKNGSIGNDKNNKPNYIYKYEDFLNKKSEEKFCAISFFEPIAL